MQRTTSITLTTLFDRQPPHALEAEMSLLGSMILEPTIVPDAAEVVKADDFYAEAHSHIYRALIDIHEQRHGGDIVQLVDALRTRKVLDAVGGIDYLETLAECVPSAVNHPHFSGIVANKARLRRLIDAAGRIIHDIYHEHDIGIDHGRELIDRAEVAIHEVSSREATRGALPVSELMERQLRRMESEGFESSNAGGVHTGYEDIDRMIRGFQPGQLVIIAGRPSSGKTALVLNLAAHMAMDAGDAPVAVFSLEMSEDEVAQRFIAMRSAVPSHVLRGGFPVSDRHMREALLAAEEIKSAPIYVDDSASLTLTDLRARARRLHQKHGIKVILVDYLQLMRCPEHAKENRQVEVASIARGLKALAKELKVSVVCLSQLNRGPETREGNRPRMSDLRESGAIEQDADIVMLIHREEYYHIGDEEWAAANPDKVGTAEIIIAKQRNGPTGSITLGWEARTTRFHTQRSSSKTMQIETPFEAVSSGGVGT